MKLLDKAKKMLGIEEAPVATQKPTDAIELPKDILTTRQGRRAYKELLKRQAKVKILALLANGYSKAEVDAILRSRG